jgi:hypothetical protein
VPNTPASGSPHTEDQRHSMPRSTSWRVSFGTSDRRSFERGEGCVMPLGGMSGVGPTRTSGDVRFRAPLKGIADIKRALIRSSAHRVTLCR